MIQVENFKISKFNERYAKKAMLKLLPNDKDSYKIYKDDGLVSKRLSKTLWYKNKIVGIYILGKINDLEKFLLSYEDGEYEDGSHCKLKILANLKKYKGRTGVIGVGLYIEPEFRGYGVGKMLMEYSENCADYICGGHAVELNNLKYWLKRRNLLAKCYVIKGGKRKLESYFTATAL